ncbi:Hypothetical protein CINCED_3A017773 [Cinara cedri]|uniref:Uncharacterized protein n=1 Tax=Cinara cedri TaxID=506608 RepID=A0A5E4N7Z1_9HEMI|nr:Hypothetical protein CINCED_3A017773 [Cinara cedri]
MTKSRCSVFAIYIFLFEIIVNAELTTVEGRSWTQKDTVSSGGPKEMRNIISPRMDFDEWTPLGRGDPLKNDPTFDYLPPVLDKVHYWKPPPPPAPANRAVFSSTAASVPVNYNRRFFLTDFSKKEPAAAAPYVQYTHKRPQIVQMSSVMGYHYPMPKTPLPMLTPPPYQRPGAAVAATTTVEPMDMSSSYLQETGNSAAESKQPPTIRAPPPMSSVRPILSHSVIKVLLENEVDRTTVTTGRTTSTPSATTATPATSSTTASTTTASTTTASTTTASTTTASAQPPPPPVTTDPVFAHYKQSAAMVAGRPMYLIIQGHSKVKTYGLLSKSEDLSVAAQSAASVQEHNHIGTRPTDDEQSRRKRDGGKCTAKFGEYSTPATGHSDTSDVRNY